MAGKLQNDLNILSEFFKESALEAQKQDEALKEKLGPPYSVYVNADGEKWGFWKTPRGVLEIKIAPTGRLLGRTARIIEKFYIECLKVAQSCTNVVDLG